MIQRVFAVYDSKARVFFRPFYCPIAEVAKRAFTTSANDPESQLCQFPADFTLFELGSFDDESGRFLQLEHHINHGQAANYKGVSSDA